MILRGRLARLDGFLVSGLVITGMCTGLQQGGLRVNASSSLPIGLYRMTSDKTAELVEFCPAEPFASVSATRGYRGKGNCPDGAQPLMKPVVALAGDDVEVSPAGVSVNGRLLPNSAARLFDTHGRRLIHWAYGHHRVSPGTVWVISSFNQRSFDSRYFGPISVASIRSHLRPLLTE